MELIKVEDRTMHNVQIKDIVKKSSGYICPMHPQIQSDTSGKCPLCGMQMEKIKILGY